MSSQEDGSHSLGYLAVPPPTPEEQSSLYLPILPRRAKKSLKSKSLQPVVMAVRSTLDEDNTVNMLELCLGHANVEHTLCSIKVSFLQSPG